MRTKEARSDTEDWTTGAPLKPFVRHLDKHFICLGVWRQAKLPRWRWGRAAAAIDNSAYCDFALFVCRNPQERPVATRERECSTWASAQTDRMYGLLCESLHDFIKESYGDDVWKLVRERADVRLHSFVTHQVHSLEMWLIMQHKWSITSMLACVCLQVYSESVIPRIAKAASGVTGTPYNELMNSWGVYFLGFVGKYGYDRILKVKKEKKKRRKILQTLWSCWRKWF